MPDSTSEKEFYEDFGDSLKPHELAQLLERARVNDDRDVRLLVKQYQALRRAATDLLTELDRRGVLPTEASSDSGSHVSYPVGFLRFMLRDESHPRPS